MTLTDDLDGSKADRTVTLDYGGVSYEIDLNRKYATTLEKSLAPDIAAARKAATRSRCAGRTRTDSQPTGGSGTDLAAVRHWARSSNGYEISDRGRIPAAVLDAYHGAH